MNKQSLELILSHWNFNVVEYSNPNSRYTHALIRESTSTNPRFPTSHKSFDYVFLEGDFHTLPETQEEMYKIFTKLHHTTR